MQLSFEGMLRAMDQVISAEFEQKGEVQNRAVLITSQEVVEHPLDWENDVGKARAFAELKQRLNVVKPERYAIIGEAWMALWPDDPALLRASKSDQRFEVVYIFLADQSGENCLATRPIETPHWSRDPKPCLGAINFTLNLEGGFADLLSRQEAPDDR